MQKAEILGHPGILKSQVQTCTKSLESECNERLVSQSYGSTKYINATGKILRYNEGNYLIGILKDCFDVKPGFNFQGNLGIS